jgi:hypothetical protein
MSASRLKRGFSDASSRSMHSEASEVTSSAPLAILTQAGAPRWNERQGLAETSERARSLESIDCYFSECPMEDLLSLVVAHGLLCTGNLLCTTVVGGQSDCCLSGFLGVCLVLQNPNPTYYVVSMVLGLIAMWQKFRPSLVDFALPMRNKIVLCLKPFCAFYTVPLA